MKSSDAEAYHIIFALICLILVISSICLLISDYNTEYDCPIYYVDCNISCSGDRKYTLHTNLGNNSNEDIVIDKLIFRVYWGKEYADFTETLITIKANSTYYYSVELLATKSNGYNVSAAPKKVIIGENEYLLQQSSDGVSFSRINSGHIFLLIGSIIGLLVTIIIILKDFEIDIFYLVKRKKTR